MKNLEEVFKKVFGKNKKMTVLRYNIDADEMYEEPFKYNNGVIDAAGLDIDTYSDSIVTNTVFNCRVDTNQKINKKKIYELYMFAQTSDKFLKLMSASDVENAHNTNYENDEKLEPEPNVIYCGFNGEDDKICSFDL